MDFIYVYRLSNRRYLMNYYDKQLKTYFRNLKPVPFMALTESEKRIVIEAEKIKDLEIDLTDCPF